MNELSTKVIWGMIGEWFGEWVRSEELEIGFVTITRFRGQESRHVFLVIKIYTLVIIHGYGKGWCDKNQLTNLVC